MSERFLHQTTAGGETVVPMDTQSAGDSQATAGTQDAPPFDLDKLLTVCGDDAAFVQQLLGTFQKQASEDCERLTHAFDAEDSGQVESVAHRLKGSAIFVAAARVRDLAARLEELARDDDLAGAAEVCGILQAEVNRCVTAEWPGQ